jgi:hypothetical protein
MRSRRAFAVFALATLSGLPGACALAPSPMPVAPRSEAEQRPKPGQRVRVRAPAWGLDGDVVRFEGSSAAGIVLRQGHGSVSVPFEAAQSPEVNRRSRARAIVTGVAEGALAGAAIAVGAGAALGGSMGLALYAVYVAPPCALLGGLLGAASADDPRSGEWESVPIDSLRARAVPTRSAGALRNQWNEAGETVRGRSVR